MSHQISVTSFDSPLGPMIAGATERGICLLEWHDRGGLERIGARLEKRYRLPLIERKNPLVDQLIAELSDYFSGKDHHFTVPLDQLGTPFERMVWQQLREIPYGRTCSYGDMARALGKPGAPRAVGRANGANCISIVVPCHRVIESTGELRGYGGGLWRKEWLLRLEGSWPVRPAAPSLPVKTAQYSLLAHQS